jgi:hypothetical protein
MLRYPVAFADTAANSLQPATAELQPARSAFVFPDTSDDLSWHASLIGTRQDARPNQWTAFRRKFILEKTPAKATARIAVDTKYWLWVNGHLVVREGGLKRGPTPTDSYFDKIDIGSSLKPGTNTVAVLVWHFGKEGFSHKDSGRSGLVFQLDGDQGKSVLVSDSSWKAIAHPAFADTGEPQPNFRLAESNIRFDATRDLGNWSASDFDDTAWPAAVDYGRVPSAPWNRLVRRPIPLWRESAVRPYSELKIENFASAVTDEKLAPEAPADSATMLRLPLASSGQTIKARLPYNAQVTPYFEIDAPAGKVIGIQTDDYQGGSANSIRAEYVTRAGRQEFECLGWMNGHAVLYSIPDGIQVLRLGYRESGYATDFAGTFHCDDDFLNRLRAKAERTLYLTMRDTYMDCPDRERAQWWGDVVNELGEVFYAFDRRADALTRKAILELIAWQNPDGVLLSPIPAGNWDRDLPLQMLAAVGREGFWTYGFFSGDFETLRAVYPGVKRYLEIWDLQPDGLIKERPGSWSWGDWGENIDMPVLANAWYHLALQGMRNMAQEFGYSHDLPWIDSRLRRIEQAFQKVYWTGDAFRSPDHQGATDDRANALAVVAGLAKPEQYPQLRSVLIKEAHASPYMEKYVLEALCLMGEPALAQDRMKQRYAKMVDNTEYTTLWEGWGIGEKEFGGGTINHAWSGGPLTIMSQYFAGIAPTSPGYKTYHICPQLGHLRNIEASVVIPQGRMSVSVHRGPSSLSLTLDSPKETRALVRLPVEKGESIVRVRLNDKIVWEGRDRSKVRGVKSVGGKNDRDRSFEVPAGHWSFVAEIERQPSNAPVE